MPLPTFLALIAGVIVMAGLSIAVVQLAGVSLIWLSVPMLALALALAARALRWH